MAKQGMREFQHEQPPVTEEELARARQLVEREPNYSPFNHDFYRLDLDKVYSLMALYARQEREAERERIAEWLRIEAIGMLDSDRSILYDLADRIRKGMLGHNWRGPSPQPEERKQG